MRRALLLVLPEWERENLRQFLQRFSQALNLFDGAPLEDSVRVQHVDPRNWNDLGVI